MPTAIVDHKIEYRIRDKPLDVVVRGWIPCQRPGCGGQMFYEEGLSHSEDCFHCLLCERILPVNGGPLWSGVGLSDYP